MKLKELSRLDVEQVRRWRNECLETLRTPFLLTEDMQQRFYEDTISSRNARARYWGIFEHKHEEYPKNDLTCDYDILLGMIGLENIEWENRRAEISIILNPEYRGKGYGEQAVDLLLEQGFFFMNLEIIWGECYTCNPALQFWKKIAKKYMARCADVPFTKFWKSQYYDSFYFAFLKEDYNYVKNNT
jgi:RimJ/RimL family protein N-acetyltransferase